MSKPATYKYLVTGAAGFIGARVAAKLIENGCEVVGIDNLNDYYDVSLKQHRLMNLEHERFSFEPIDIEDQAKLAELFKQHQFKAILNLAARAGVRYSMENPHVYLSTNSGGNLNLLEQARIHRVEKFVLASTSSLYAGQPMPFVESLPGNTPISPYAASKKSAELMAYSYHFLYGIDVSVCRYFTVYGPCGRPDMAIFRFIKWIDDGMSVNVYGDGEQSRDFTYVDDIAAGTIAALKPVGYEVINLGGGETPVSLNAVIAKIEDGLGKKAVVNHLPFHKADVESTQAQIDKAGRILQWKPSTGLSEGIQACVDWYVDNKPWTSSIVLP